MARVSINVKNSVLKNGIHMRTSPFGMRNGKMHNGVDLIGNGTTDYIVAFADGTVKSMLNTCSGKIPSQGNYVTIDHGNGIQTVYYHMKKGTVKVNVGQKVKRGDVLGYMGNTGNSFGAHLHFGIKINGTWVDPEPYLLGEKELFPKSLDEDLKVLEKAGIMNTPAYWKDRAGTVQYLPELIHNMANYVRK